MPPRSPQGSATQLQGVVKSDCEIELGFTRGMESLQLEYQEMMELKVP